MLNLYITLCLIATMLLKIQKRPPWIHEINGRKAKILNICKENHETIQLEPKKKKKVKHFAELQ